MKRSIRHAVSMILCSALLGQTLSAAAYTGLGEILSASRETVGNGLVYSEYAAVTEAGSENKAYIFEYDPKGTTLPIVRFGNTIYGRDRLGTMTETEWAEHKTVNGAVNGDFYSMQTGVPLGVMIDDGNLISTDDSRYALGFLEDGSAVIGKPQVKLSLTNVTQNGPALEIDQLNKFPTIWGVYLLTEDFSSTTLSASESLEIIIELDSEIRVHGSVSGRVREIINGDCNSSIPEGCAVLTVAASYEDYPLFTAIRKGDEIRIDTSCTDGWQDVVTAVGGGDLILDGGVMPEGIINEDHEKVKNPRTAVGIRADGTVLFFAVDGKTSVRGLTETELASVMAEHGCVTALNLDGGGSTTVMVKHASDRDCTYMNVPSDGFYRSVANGILFVSEHTPDGVPAFLAPKPASPYLLRGSTVDFSAEILDITYMPVGITLSSEGVEVQIDPSMNYADDIGSVSGGSFTAGFTPGEYRLKLSAQDGALKGDASVNVTYSIDSLTVSPSFTRAFPGSVTEFDIKATWQGNDVICDSKSFYYTLNGTHVMADTSIYPDATVICDLGYIDKAGRFVAFDDAEGEVEVGVWFDDFVRYVTVKVGSGADRIADFETDGQLGSFRFSTDGSGIFVGIADGFKSKQSIGIGFDYKNAAASRILDVQLREKTYLSSAAASVRVWVSGDISGKCFAVVTDERGVSHELVYSVTKDYSRQLGWRELTARIPDSLKNGVLTLDSLLVITDYGTGSRAIAIDDPCIDYGFVPAPAISGLEGHWAANSILTLYDMGVIGDEDCKNMNGARYYDPGAVLTRGEFAKLFMRWRGIDVTPYETYGVTLETEIPADLLPYIRAAIAHGMMSGRSTGEDGSVIFDANAVITREEVMKVIGILLSTTPSALSFSDIGEISGWAYEGIAKCVAAGVVRGYEDNTIRPRATISRAELAVMLERIK